MASDGPDAGIDRPEAEEAGGLSWSICLGAVAGLVAGVVLAMAGAACLHAWQPEGRAAEMFWGIASPLLGVAGVVAGAMVFQRYLRERVAVAAVLALGTVALGLFLALAVVGFPWKAGG